MASNDPNMSRRCFPQLLLPFKSKDDFILPESHKKYLIDKLNEVNDILIIGWKGTEENFLNLLRDRIGNKYEPIKTLVVNGIDRSITKSLKKALPNSTIQFFDLIFAKTIWDNTILPYNLATKERNLFHNTGSFSSYTLNVIEKKFKNFFT